VIMGASKVSDKIGVLKALMEKADTILIGGAMANTFFRAQGIPIGKSRVESDKLDLALNWSIWRRSAALDFCCRSCGGSGGNPRGRGDSKHEPARAKHGVSDGWQAVDIGTATIRALSEEIAKAETILWNGPLGIL